MRDKYTSQDGREHICETDVLEVMKKFQERKKTDGRRLGNHRADNKVVAPGP
jgi:hypothetical protein